MPTAQALLLLLALRLGALSGAALPPLPALRLDASTVTISGISSGADLAAHAAVALSDAIAGAAIFAGEPWLCAVVRFPGEPTYPCAQRAGGSPGPGCGAGAGYPSAAPCQGCGGGAPNATLSYDHCKKDAASNPPVLVAPPVLVGLARAAAAAGRIPPTAHLARTRVLGFRGDRDAVYLAGSVNKTTEFFAAFASDAGAQVRLVTGWPMQHALPTVDPAVSPATCGVSSAGPPAMANCGYDGAGEALRHMYGPSVALTPPASPACDAACVDRLVSFDQTRYFAADWAGRELSSLGWLYVPSACSVSGGSGGGGGAPCKLHISLHGCGMSVWSAAMGANYTRHSGFNVWGEANNIVRLGPREEGASYCQRDAQHSPFSHSPCLLCRSFCTLRAAASWRGARPLRRLGS